MKKKKKKKKKKRKRSVIMADDERDELSLFLKGIDLETYDAPLREVFGASRVEDLKVDT